MRQAPSERNAAQVLRVMRPAGEVVRLPWRSPLALWTADAADWDGEGAAVLLLADADRASRRSALRDLLARVPGKAHAEISILHRDWRGPMITSPAGEVRRPALSSSSRGRFSAVSVAACAVGIDVEAIGPAEDIPWGTLHPDEVQPLRSAGGPECAIAFARIWSAKEAYLKALRIGLSRDPATLRVTLGPDGATAIHVDERPHAKSEVETAVIALGQASFVATLCLIGPNAT